MSPALDSARLMAACRTGATDERAEAFQTLGRHMYRALWPRVGHDPRLANLAEDCVQEALVKVWRALEAGRGPDNPDRFVSWATRVAANTLVSELRKVDPAADVARPKRVGLRRQVSLEAAAEPEEGPPRALAVDDAGLEDRVARAELAAQLAEIRDMGALSVSSRTVLLQGYLAEWADDELADHLRTTRANVHVIRCRDLAKLRRDAGFMDRLAAVVAVAP